MTTRAYRDKVRRRLIEQARYEETGGNASRQTLLPLGLPTVIAALTGTASVEEMAFSLGLVVLEQDEVAGFFAMYGSRP